MSVKCPKLSGVSLELWVNEDLNVYSTGRGGDFRAHFNEWGVHGEGGNETAIF